MPNQNSDPRSSLIKYASFILNRKPYFRHKLREKLIQRSQKLKFSDYAPLVDDIIEDLSKSGYLNDSYLAEAFVRRQLAKGYGPRIISLKLRQLKLTSETISLALESQASPKEQLLSARALVAKKRLVDHRKASYTLAQRGFDYRTINKLFDVELAED